MTTPKDLERIEKLFALADSPFEEEARTAALKAVRLMKKHGLVPRLPASADPERVHTPPQAAPAQQPYQPPRAYHPPGFDKYRSANAARSSACKACGQLYEVGEPVLIGIIKFGVTHVRCRAYWDE